MLVRVHEDQALSMKCVYEWLSVFEKVGKVYLTKPSAEDRQPPSVMENIEKWIPAHCDIAGNEHANFLAKKGALVIEEPTRISTFLLIWPLSIIEMKTAEMSKDKNSAILNEISSWFLEKLL
ncbi:hypothetical protein TNCV_487021 [Trichonephila clavipes]|nr:hypothetical protein TNCV_487021 [Trichonephila clavipes]